MIEYVNFLEFTGSFLKGIDEDPNPFCVPFSLTKVKGVNACDMTSKLFKTIAEVTNFSIITRYF